jgi:hypothetical protein
MHNDVQGLIPARNAGLSTGNQRSRKIKQFEMVIIEI